MRPVIVHGEVADTQAWPPLAGVVLSVAVTV